MDNHLEFLDFYPNLRIAIACIFGGFIGSFLNVVIYRLPKTLMQNWRAEAREVLELAEETQATFNLALPNSHCPNCKTPIAIYDNIPILSWLLLRARCRHCQVKISCRYPIVELTCALFAGLAALIYGPNITALLWFTFLAVLLAAALIDYDTTLLPDQLTLPLLWLGLLASATGHTSLTPSDAIVGAAAGYLSLWLVYHAFRLLTGKHGMGYGDFKLLAALGAWLGWMILPLIILMSSLVGAVVGISLVLLKKHERSRPIPFGPYLAAAGVITLFFGERLTTWYYSGFIAPS